MKAQHPRAVAVAVTVVLGCSLLIAARSAAATVLPAFVQGNFATLEPGNGTIGAAPFAQPNTAGDLIVVYVISGTGASVTDKAGDTYRVASPLHAWTSAYSGEVFYAQNVTGGTNTVQVSFGAPLVRHSLIYVMEYSGVDKANALDKTSTGTGTGPVMSSGVMFTTGPDLVVGAGVSQKTITSLAAGYKTRSTAYGNLVEDKNLLKAGTPVSTATQNGSGWMMQAVAFHAATATPPTEPPTTAPTVPTEPSTVPTPPMSGQPDRCVFTSFCEDFQTIHAGGRAGDLDESKWSAARVTQATNPSAGLVDNFAPFVPEFCLDHNTPPRVPDNDSFICGQQFGESNHWMEGMNDQDSYVVNSFRPVQPFDFAGRTSTLDFSVDARTQGSHSAWIEAWLTPDPTQVPHEDFPGTHMFPRQGVEFLFDADWCGSTPANALRLFAVYDRYQVADEHDFQYSPCFTTQDDHANHFQLRVSQNHIEVWASNDDGSHFTLRGAGNVNLPFTRGYWSLQHSQYAADKFNNMQTTTYHWHAVSFDGPALPADGSYQVPDSLTPGPNGSVNLGYQTNTPTFTLTNVDPTGATAFLAFDVYWYSSPLALNVTINGKTTRVPDPTPDIESHRYQWHFLTVPVALSDLVTGSNTVQISNTGCAGNCPTVANIDLELVR